MRSRLFATFVGVSFVVTGLIWTAPAVSAQDAALVKRGEELYKTLPNKCSTCHKVGTKIPGAKMGPDLEGVANRHPEAWFAPYLANPKSINPKNVMPPVKVSDADMKALVAFLMTLKGGK
jgi:mono/diheme cytochrome c family protein